MSIPVPNCEPYIIAVSNKHKSEKMIPLNFKCNDAEKRGRKLCNFATHTHINYSNKTSTVFRTDPN